MEALHQLNITGHVTFGTLALIIGVFILIYPKISTLHRSSGKVFIRLMAGVLFTALVGSLYFQFRPFLFLLSLTALYTSVMGIRVLKLKGNRPGVKELTLIAITIVSLIIYPAFEATEVVTAKNDASLIATLVNLGMNIVYDLGKWFYPKRWLISSRIPDHLVRMISSLSALFSAFTANALPGNWQPYSQLIPSTICIALMIYFSYRWINGSINRPTEEDKKNVNPLTIMQ